MIWAKFFNENFQHDYFFLSNVRAWINPALRWEWLNSYTVFLKCEKIHISVEICGICENYLTEAFFLTDLTDGTDLSCCICVDL